LAPGTLWKPRPPQVPHGAAGSPASSRTRPTGSRASPSSLAAGRDS
jgi:hypothetical protein